MLIVETPLNSINTTIKSVDTSNIKDTSKVCILLSLYQKTTIQINGTKFSNLYQNV